MLMPIRTTKAHFVRNNLIFILHKPSELHQTNTELDLVSLRSAGPGPLSGLKWPEDSALPISADFFFVCFRASP